MVIATEVTITEVSVEICFLTVSSRCTFPNNVCSIRCTQLTMLCVTTVFKFTMTASLYGVLLWRCLHDTGATLCHVNVELLLSWHLYVSVSVAF